MTDARQLVKKYLKEKNIMQLATSADGKAWSCNLHFYADDDMNLYWISLEAREHSQMINENPVVSAAVLVHEGNQSERYIIGLSISGRAELVHHSLDKSVKEAFFAKHGTPPAVRSDIMSGQDEHKFYRLTPDRIVLFDTLNFKEEPRQEIVL